jgi:hypothetical protein
VFTLYAGTLLHSENLAHGRVGAGAAWNGEPVIDEVQFFRAANATVYGRADGPERFTQRVWRFFSSEAAALTFAATHRSTLPLQGDLTLRDDAGTVALTMAGAVRAVRIEEIDGLAVLVEYTFTGSRFASDDVPEIPDDPPNVKTGIVTLDADDESKAVAFDIAFGAAPKFVGVQIAPPTGEPGFDAWPVKDTITASGFTAKLGAIVPGTGYELRWTAIL